MLGLKQIKTAIAKRDGKERIHKDSLHYGVGETVYTYREDAIAAGCIVMQDYILGHNPTFAHLTDSGIVKVLRWLNRV